MRIVQAADVEAVIADIKRIDKKNSRLPGDWQLVL